MSEKTPAGEAAERGAFAAPFEAEKRIEALEALQLKIEKEMSDAQDAAYARMQDVERKHFIRQAVIAFYAQDSTWATETYWIRANALWAAKPEDC